MRSIRHRRKPPQLSQVLDPRARVRHDCRRACARGPLASLPGIVSNKNKTFLHPLADTFLQIFAN